MQGECRGMQGECRGMQGECRGMQGECRGMQENARGMQGNAETRLIFAEAILLKKVNGELKAKSRIFLQSLLGSFRRMK